MHFPTQNVKLCVLCHRLFCSDVNIANMEDYIRTRYKGLKSRKIANVCTFVW